MAVLKGAELALGSPMPAFRLKDVEGTEITQEDFSAQVLVVCIWCNHCPYVKHVADAVISMARSFSGEDVQFVAVSSNSPEREPLDSVEEMRREIADRDYPFPYLVDESQAVARAFQAVCTPDFYVYAGDRLLSYHGRFDDSRPGGPTLLTGSDLRAAIVSALDGSPAPDPQLPAMGCSIKWTTPQN